MNHVQHLQIKTRLNLIKTAVQWRKGYDTTGERLDDLVPSGHIRIFELQAESFRKKGYTVIRKTEAVPDGDRKKQVTLVLVDLTSASDIPAGYLNQHFEPSRRDSDPTFKPSASSGSRVAEDSSDELQSTGT